MKPILTIIVGIMAAVALLPLAPIILPLALAWYCHTHRQQISEASSKIITNCFQGRPPMGPTPDDKRRQELQRSLDRYKAGPASKYYNKSK